MPATVARWLSLPILPLLWCSRRFLPPVPRRFRHVTLISSLLHFFTDTWWLGLCLPATRGPILLFFLKFSDTTKFTWPVLLPPREAPSPVPGDPRSSHGVVSGGPRHIEVVCSMVVRLLLSNRWTFGSSPQSCKCLLRPARCHAPAWWWIGLPVRGGSFLSSLPSSRAPFHDIQPLLPES